MSGGKAQYSKLEYVAQKPSFLTNFGAPPRSERGERSGRERDGDGDLPSRPKDGKWAEGSDEEDEEGDEWDAQFGGGEGPQVVVLKEGRHLSAEEVARERRRAAGLPSPPPTDKEKEREDKEDKEDKDKDAGDKKRTRPTPAGHKRKLVGEAVAAAAPEASEGKKKKKKKAAKGLLSFDEAEGE